MSGRSGGVALALALACACGAPNPAYALEFYGYGEEAIAVRVTEDGDVIYHRQTLNTKFTDSFTESLSWRFEVDFWHDKADFQSDHDFRLRVREAYVKLELGDLDIRAGRRQIAWGEADGVIVSDQVAPFDLTNFIVPKFDAIRLGVDGTTLDYYFDNGDDIQLIWLVDFQEPDFPDNDSPWSFLDEDELAAMGIAVEAPVVPDNELENTEVGLRYSGHPIWADWSVGFLHSWDDRPAPRLISDSPLAPPRLIPTHERFELFTGNVAYPIGDYLVRVDSAYEMGRYLPTSDFAAFDDDFVSRHDVWRTMVAVDMKPNVPWWSQADATVQYVREQVIDPEAGLLAPTQQDLLSVRLMAAYRNDTIKPWLFWIYDVRGSNTWLQARLDYEPFDEWKVSLEYDRFAGHDYDPTRDNGGIFGRFAGNDLVQLAIRRSY